MVVVDLTRHCDSCSWIIGSSFNFCLKCKIAYCLTCWLSIKNKVCPIFGKKWADPNDNQVLKESFKNLNP